ncbi:MAG TPA: hypothetical protein VK249_23805 [Anaerolineales bacterium]|nr:hypothetical protein [Anaerolineales bacterium]
MKHISKMQPFFVFPMTVLLVHFVAITLLHLYKIFPNLDIPFHYVGGLAVAFTSAQILSYLEKEELSAPLNRVICLVLIISLTATAAVFWEFGEFISDKFLGTDFQLGLADTMKDQFMGILGGATLALIYFRRTGRRRVPRITETSESI